jgi:UDP-glucose 4-epimerase
MLIKKENVLIVGSQGFIGEHLAESLSKEYNIIKCVGQVNSLDESFVSYEQVLANESQVLSKIDFCINCAGKGNVAFSFKDSTTDFLKNVTEVHFLLDALRLHNPKCKYLHISSAAVYGNPNKLPVNETDETLPISPYGFHKLESEMVNKQYYHLFDLPIGIVRPFSVYGNGLKKQIVWDICNKVKANSQLELYGTGGETRDFIHINDFCAAINLILKESPFVGDIYNLANGEETKISEIVNCVIRYYDKDVDVTYNGTNRMGDPLNWRANIDKLKHMGYKKQVTIEEGIKDYVNWFKTIKHD